MSTETRTDFSSSDSTAEDKPKLHRQMFPLETRTVQIEGQDREFDFLVVDKPEKWEEATTFRQSLKLGFPGTPRILKIPVRGLSYSEWLDIETKYTMPIQSAMQDMNEVQKQEYQDKQKSVENYRSIAVFEKATGKEIPGGSLEEKVAWLSHLGSGDSEIVFSRILEHFSNMQEGTLLTDYLDAIRSKDNQEVFEFNDFDDWIKASEIGYRFQMQRPFESYFVEIQLKKLDDQTKKEIGDQTKDPLPPSKPGKNPTTGMPDPAFPIYNWDDSRYRNQVKANSQRRLILLLNAVMPFEIPGKDEAAQLEWVGKRLLGDVVRLRSFLEENVINYRGRVNFF